MPAALENGTNLLAKLQVFGADMRKFPGNGVRLVSLYVLHALLRVYTLKPPNHPLIKWHFMPSVHTHTHMYIRRLGCLMTLARLWPKRGYQLATINQLLKKCESFWLIDLQGLSARL